MDEKQVLLLENLKLIKETCVAISLSKLDKSSGIDTELQEKIETSHEELAEEVIYRILELIDGYSDLAFEVDLIVKETKSSLRDGIELHDKFIDFLAMNA
ncbi:hypothetical protein ACP26L_27860 [Paenibacillus sp. S-38]|uniref:hypothetical protein n=1 Tax=Paenibacillus sp. S-38 TaxID=3416710 RepID=UPI003CF51020